MKVVLSYLKPYKWFALIALGLMLLELVAELAQPIIIAKIIDEGIVLKDFHVIFLWGCMLIGIASLH